MVTTPSPGSCGATGQEHLLHRQPTAPELLMTALAADPDLPAIVADDRVYTRGDVVSWVSRIAQVLITAGLGAGTPVGLLSRNRPETLLANAAAMIVGCRLTALSPVLSVADLAFIAEDAGLEALIVDPDAFAGAAERLAAEVPSLRRLLTLGPVPGGGLAESIDLWEQAGRYEPQPLSFTPRDPEEASSLIYTGGTTGRPKGVLNSYRMGSALAQIQLAEWEWPSNPRFLVCTPLSHAGGAFFLPVLSRGGSLRVMPKFDPSAVLDEIESGRVDSLMLVPTMLYALLDDPSLPERDLSGLRRIYYGAASAAPARIRQALDRFGPVLFQYYGQSECGMSIAVLRPQEHLGDPRRLGSCGRPVRWLDVRVLDDSLREVPVGEVGEICIRGPLTTAGYWNRPAETQELLRGGWLHTGDLARRDEEGFLYIVDRSKDMIVTGGFNVYSSEVEQVLAEVEGVAEVAVVGASHAKWGEEVVACIVERREGPPPSDEVLLARVRTQKGPVYTPKRIVRVPGLPRTALGKIDKKELRALVTAPSEPDSGH